MCYEHIATLPKECSQYVLIKNRNFKRKKKKSCAALNKLQCSKPYQNFGPHYRVSEKQKGKDIVYTDTKNNNMDGEVAV